MNEIEYIDRIDTCFPFGRARKWKPVIDQGVSLSDNAAYMALFAIAVARPRDLPRRESQRMIDYWSSKYDHPTKAMVLAAARAIIWNKPLSQETALKDMDAVAPYRNLCNALGIIHAAVRPDDCTGDTPASVEQKCREIIAQWG